MCFSLPNLLTFKTSLYQVLLWSEGFISSSTWQMVLQTGRQILGSHLLNLNWLLRQWTLKPQTATFQHSATVQYCFLGYNPRGFGPHPHCCFVYEQPCLSKLWLTPCKVLMKSPDTTASGGSVLPHTKGLSKASQTPYGQLALKVKDIQTHWLNSTWH